MIKIICLMTAFALAPTPSAGSEKKQVTAEEYVHKYQLIKRNWEIRYILQSADVGFFKIRSERARKNNAENRRAHRPVKYREFEGLFDPNFTFAYSKINALAIEVIVFDRDGRVISPHHSKFTLIGKRTDLDYVTLIEKDNWAEPPYHLAYWFMGLSGADADFAPAVCDIDDFQRYRKGWKVERYSPSGNFGCREWTDQLHDYERPYIDVTSYEKEGTFIKEFTGWSRFADPPKPVIGRNDKTWLCLFDCPGGEPPGVIADIAAWAKKNGYPVPRPPDKQPTFPDADFENSAEE
jgi:hypothetical protein